MSPCCACASATDRSVKLVPGPFAGSTTNVRCAASAPPRQRTIQGVMACCILRLRRASLPPPRDEKGTVPFTSRSAVLPLLRGVLEAVATLPGRLDPACVGPADLRRARRPEAALLALRLLL